MPPALPSFVETAARKVRDAVVAGDPGLTRLRMGSRVTLTLVLVASALAASHRVAPLPAAAYAVALTLALQGAIAIRDATHRHRIVTRAMAAVAGFLVLAALSPLAAHPPVVDAIFLLVAFLAVYARKWGARWNAVGMFSFMACFIGAYFRPVPSDLGAIAFALALSAVIADFVRDRLVPDRPSGDVRRTLSAVDKRIAAVVSAIRRAGREGWTPEARDGAVAAVQRVKDALAVAEGFLPADGGGATGPRDAAATLSIRLFDLHLATETALAASIGAAPEDETAPERLKAALDRLARLRLDARKAAAALTDEALDRAAPPSAAAAAGEETAPKLWRDPAFRLAAQVVLACAIAMAGGLLVSEQRWFWAVLTAFLVFTNSQSRGDTALRGINRALGTGLGIVAGIGMATLFHDAFALSLAMIGACVFLGFYVLQVSYAGMTFFMTVALSLLYGLLGNFSPGLLVVRLEETLIGAAAGVGVAFLVFPQRTDAASGKAVEGFLAELDRLLAAAGEFGRGEASSWRVMAVTRALDRRHGEIAAAIRPLDSGWLALSRRRIARRALLRFTVLAYWAHQLAGALQEKAPATADPDYADGLAACRRDLAALRQHPADIFSETRTAALTPPKTTARGSDLAQPDAILAIHAIRHILGGIRRPTSAKAEDPADERIPTENPLPDRPSAGIAEISLPGKPKA